MLGLLAKQGDMKHLRAKPFKYHAKKRVHFERSPDSIAASPAPGIRPLLKAAHSNTTLLVQFEFSII